MKISLRVSTATIAAAALCTVGLTALPAAAAPALTATAAAAAPAASATSTASAAAAYGKHDRERRYVGIKLLSVNDFHG